MLLVEENDKYNIFLNIQGKESNLEIFCILEFPISPCVTSLDWEFPYVKRVLPIVYSCYITNIENFDI